MPTMEAVEMYYTKNGLPLGRRPAETKDDGPLCLQRRSRATVTACLHCNREPRFYASIGFDRGTYRD
ncbi:MAG: hypothetical protein ACLUGU_06155 [Alistipes shahii]